MDIKERILVALGLDKSEDEIKLAFQAKGEDGTIFVSTAEELESGVELTFSGSGQTATITGNIIISGVGNASQNIRLDVDKILSII